MTAKMSKRKTVGIVKAIQRHKDAIAKHRDELRYIYEDLESVIGTADAGVNELESAIETLSQYL